MDTQLSEPQSALVDRISKLLAKTMGAVPFEFGFDRLGWSATPFGSGLCAGAAFATFFCAGPAFVFGWASVDRHILWLSLYGAAYSFWAVWIARSASVRVLEIVRTRVVPLLSDVTADQIRALLHKNFEPGKLSGWSLCIALLAAVASGVVVYRDGANSILQIVWFCLGWFAIYVTAARATLTARFYLFISKSLKLEQSAIFAVDPTDTALVRAVESVSRTVLLFWFGIVISIAFLYVFDAIGNGDLVGQQGGAGLFEPHWPSHFVLIVLPVTSFFSFFLGSYVFIQSEYAINDVVGNSIHELLRSIETETAELLSRRLSFTEMDWKRLKELTSLHKQVASRSFYRRYFASGLSLLVPLVTVAVPFIQIFTGSK